MLTKTLLVLLFCISCSSSHEDWENIDYAKWQEGIGSWSNSKYGWIGVAWECPCLHFVNAPAYIASQTFCADMSREKAFNGRPHFKSDAKVPLYIFFKRFIDEWKVSLEYNNDDEFVMVAKDAALRPQNIKAPWNVTATGLLDPNIQAKCGFYGYTSGAITVGATAPVYLILLAATRLFGFP